MPDLQRGDTEKALRRLLSQQRWTHRKLPMVSEWEVPGIRARSLTSSEKGRLREMGALD